MRLLTPADYAPHSHRHTLKQRVNNLKKFTFVIEPSVLLLDAALFFYIALFNNTVTDETKAWT